MIHVCIEQKVKDNGAEVTSLVESRTYNMSKSDSDARLNESHLEKKDQNHTFHTTSPVRFNTHMFYQLRITAH